MKKLILALVMGLVISSITAQNTKFKLYHPEANAEADLQKSVQKAKIEGKHVLVQVGGNWCKWCIAFNKKVTENDTLKTALDKNLITYHLNYSKENWNEATLAKLGYPQRFGFPVFVVLDGNGNVIHTQNSAYLEEGKSYSTKKVANFFKHWSTTAIDPKSYPSKVRKK